ncbi:MAG TPA: DUF1570 domain-containing protein [Pirellulales bacterium]|nr:DUF1570 domain-containing protein [Pirellulales bacterium]
MIETTSKLFGPWVLARRLARLGGLLSLVLASAGRLDALDHLLIRRAGSEREVSGRVLETAEDGGLLLIAEDGVLWSVPPEELLKRTTDDKPFAPLSQAELGKRLLAELPSGFEIHTTQNYLICHNTSKAYAQWCGALFEQLYRGFTNYWSRKGFDLTKPEFPLVAIVFADKFAYANFARPELGDASEAIIGYYSFQTNRMTMYDLTGIESLRQPGDRRTTATQINEMLGRPEAERTVATIIHEATHQLAFNCGMQIRYSDIPLWVSEGLAVFFETPDVHSSKGWSTIGSVNRPRLNVFRQSLAGRPTDSLQTLISDDRRFRDTKQAQEAYAEAWALHYFLSRQRSKQYVEYLKLLSRKPRLIWDDPATRLQDFRQFFGDDLHALDVEFVRYMSKVR